MADLIFILVVTVFAVLGLKRGFIKTVLGLASTIISLILTALLYPPIANFVYDTGLGDSFAESFAELASGKMDNEIIIDAAATTASTVCINVISFLIVIIAIKILLSLLLKSLDLVSKLPVIKQANSALGLCVGIISGLLLSYIAIGVISSLSYNGFLDASWNENFKNSIFVSLFYDENIVKNLLFKIM